MQVQTVTILVHVILYTKAKLIDLSFRFILYNLRRVIGMDFVRLNSPCMSVHLFHDTRLTCIYLILLCDHFSTFRDMKLIADYQKKKQSNDIEIIIDTTGELKKP